MVTSKGRRPLGQGGRPAGGRAAVGRLGKLRQGQGRLPPRCVCWKEGGWEGGREVRKQEGSEGGAAIKRRPTDDKPDEKVFVEVVEPIVGAAQA